MQKKQTIYSNWKKNIQQQQQKKDVKMTTEILFANGKITTDMNIYWICVCLE